MEDAIKRAIASLEKEQKINTRRNNIKRETKNRKKVKKNLI